jgi:hypothetical protein
VILGTMGYNGLFQENGIDERKYDPLTKVKSRGLNLQRD